MRIGLVVDGQSEVAALPNLYPRLEAETGHQFLRPVLAPIQPLAPPAAIARACGTRVSQLARRGADRVLVLVDREGRPECPGVLALEIQGRLPQAVTTTVVIKNRTFENWLIADVQALLQQPGRFDVSAGMRSRIEPNHADSADALRLLQRAAIRTAYNKVQDSQRTLARAAPCEMASNSRSFRRFLRCSDHPLYRRQSRHPG